MQALSSALSLSGNSHESERSQTKSAISENIRIDTKTPEKLTALSRDTKNANQQVNKQDLKKVQERQEMAKVIGEIANNAISIATYEEQLMGSNAQTGAISTAAGELGAKYLTEHLYSKEAKNLSETERSQIKEMAKALAGVAGGLVAAGQGASAVKILKESSIGATVANNAVEHNFLSTLSQNRRDVLEKKIKEGKASQKEIMEFISYEQDDHTSDYLADKARNHPEKMTNDEWSRLGNYLQRYVSESVRSRETPDEINRSVKDIVSGNYIKGYGYAYALDDKYRSDLPSRWSWSDADKSEREKFYSDLKYQYVTKPKVISDSFDGKVSQSTKDALETLSVVYGGAGVFKGAQTINNLMSNSTKFTLGIAGAGSVGGQLLANGEVDSRTLAIDVVTAYALKGRGFITTVGGNAASGAFNSYVTDQSIVQGAIGSGVGAGIGYGIGKTIEIPLSKKYPDLTWAKYNPQSLNNKLPYIESYRRSIVPSILGSGVGESINRGAQYYYGEKQKGNK